MEEVAKHFLCMARQCRQLPDYIGQATIGNSLKFIWDRQLEGAATNRYRLYNPLRQWHDEILYSATVQWTTEGGPRRGPNVLVTPEDGSRTMVAQSGALSNSHLLFKFHSAFLPTPIPAPLSQSPISSHCLISLFYPTISAPAC